MFRKLISLVSTVSIGLVGHEVQAWDSVYYEPVEVPVCLNGELVLRADDDECVQGEAYLEFYLFDSTADGLTPVYNSMLQVSAIAPTASGQISGVMVVQSVRRPEFGTIMGWEMVEEVRIREAYLALVGESEIMIGQKRTVGRFDEDEARGMFGPLGSDQSNLGHFSRPLSGAYVPDRGVLLPESVALEGMGASMQIRMHPSPGWTSFVGLEEVDKFDGGAVVVGSALAGDGVAGHFTLVSDGVLDGEVSDLGAHGVLLVESDLLEATFAIVATTSGYWHGLASAGAHVGPFVVAGSVEQLSSDEWGWAGSVGIELGSVQSELGLREYRTPIANAHQIAAALSFAPTETLAARLELGSYSTTTSGYSDHASYMAVQLRWEPGGGRGDDRIAPRALQQRRRHFRVGHI